MKSRIRIVSALFFSSSIALASCSGDDEGDGSGSGGSGNRPDETGAACEVASDCYPDVADGELHGEAVCIDRVRDGYCTHTCETDDDCCATEGECNESLHEVCSPFESMGGMHCFVSCESEDVDAATDTTDEQDYCQKRASTDFICRSSGGGSGNRKICVPGDCGVGARCTDVADCAADLECVTGFNGGYCTLRGCTLDDECPDGSRCVNASNGESYCYRSCTEPSDCSFCRNADAGATCSDDVTLAEPDMPGSVCVPN